MKYNSPLMKILETVANMLIVSFFWVVCSIPVLTIVPASVALYHTSNKIIFDGSGNGVIKDFFVTFKDNFVYGLKVNVILLIAAFFIVIGLNTGFQIYQLSTWGLAYLILGFLITFVCVTSVIYVPAVISKFYLKIMDTFRLAIFFASQNLFMSIINVLVLVLMAWIIYAVPLALFIAPALYVDLVRINMEKKMVKFISDNNLQDLEVKPDIPLSKEDEDVSLWDINKKLRNNRKNKK